MAASFRTILFLIVAALVPATAWCVQVNIPLIEQKPTVDGRVSASEQAAAEPIQLTKIGGLDRPRFQTQVFVSATLDGIYVGFIAEDPRPDAAVTSTTEENGAVFDDDSVQVLLTPTLETSADSYYHFAVNPDGTRYSNHLITGETVENWESAVSKSANSWQAEFFIPLNSIDAPAELPHWRGNFARNRPARTNEDAETSVWVNPGISLHNYKRFGYLTMPRFVGPAPEGNDEFTTDPVAVAPDRDEHKSIVPTGSTAGAGAQ